MNALTTEGYAGKHRQTAGCNAGTAKLLQSFKGFRGFKRFKRFRCFKGLRAGKRQAWTPRRSDGCGLGVAFACAVGRSAKLLQSFKGFRGFKRFKGFKGLRAGKRQAWTPIRSH